MELLAQATQTIVEIIVYKTEKGWILNLIQ